MLGAQGYFVYIVGGNFIEEGGLESFFPCVVSFRAERGVGNA